MKRITADVLGKLASIQLLQTMHLVTKAFCCPAFSMYLSDTSECAIILETNILIQDKAVKVSPWLFLVQRLLWRPWAHLMPKLL